MESLLSLVPSFWDTLHLKSGAYCTMRDHGYSVRLKQVHKGWGDFVTQVVREGVWYGIFPQLNPDVAYALGGCWSYIMTAPLI